VTRTPFWFVFRIPDAYLKAVMLLAFIGGTKLVSLAGPSAAAAAQNLFRAGDLVPFQNMYFVRNRTWWTAQQ